MCSVETLPQKRKFDPTTLSVLQPTKQPNVIMEPVMIVINECIGNRFTAARYQEIYIRHFQWSASPKTTMKEKLDAYELFRVQLQQVIAQQQQHSVSTMSTTTATTEIETLIYQKIVDALYGFMNKTVHMHNEMTANVDQYLRPIHVLVDDFIRDRYNNPVSAHYLSDEKVLALMERVRTTRNTHEVKTLVDLFGSQYVYDAKARSWVRKSQTKASATAIDRPFQRIQQLIRKHTIDFYDTFDESLMTLITLTAKLHTLVDFEQEIDTLAGFHSDLVCTIFCDIQPVRQALIKCIDALFFNDETITTEDVNALVYRISNDDTLKKIRDDVIVPTIQHALSRHRQASNTIADTAYALEFASIFMRVESCAKKIDARKYMKQLLPIHLLGHFRSWIDKIGEKAFIEFLHESLSVVSAATSGTRDNSAADRTEEQRERDDRLCIFASEYVNNKLYFFSLYHQAFLKRLLKQHFRNEADERLQAENTIITAFLDSPSYAVMTRTKIVPLRDAVVVTSNEFMATNFIDASSGKSRLACCHQLKILSMNLSPKNLERDHCMHLSEYRCPEKIASDIDTITDTYQKVYPNRKLTFLQHMSRVECVWRPTLQIQYAVTCTMYQALALSVLSEVGGSGKFIAKPIRAFIHPTFTYSAIVHAPLVQALATLVKTRLVCIVDNVSNKPVDGMDFNQVTSEYPFFVANEKFRHKQLKINISSIVVDIQQGNAQQSATSSSEETKAECARVYRAAIIEQRQLLELNIVRIMKSEKTMEMSALCTRAIQEVMRYFKPTTVDVKIVVEALIEKEYMTRDETKRSRLHYQA